MPEIVGSNPLRTTNLKIIIMEIYKEASKQQLRFATSKGNLSVEQLWGLSVAELDELAVKAEEEYKTSGKKSFVVKKAEKNKVAKLKFEILLDVLNTKVEEHEAALTAEENQEHNEKIMQMIVEKKDEELKGKSIKELTKLLK